MMLEYSRHLNRLRERLDEPVTVREILGDSRNFRGYDLNEEGYSLIAQLTFDYDQCPVNLIGLFGHNDPQNPSAGVHLSLLTVAADSDEPRIIYSLFPIPATYAKR